MAKYKSKIVIELPYLMPGLNGKDGLMREHWASRKKRFANLITEIRAKGGKPYGWESVSITYERHAVRLMDWDNAAASFKLIGDALEKLNYIKDDSPYVIKEFIPKQEKVSKFINEKTVITIIKNE